ncbi:MAG: N-acetyltransferase [Desulfobacteraceae bacterium]|nr:N-acetyltransferase [Desulfobacteraceae bacterium]
MHIRRAVVEDVKAIHKIINHYADQGLLLPRSLSEFYDHLRDYFVLENDYERHSILGVCGLGICWEDLAEIKSLAVSEDQQGKGFGFQLVEVCLKDARSLGLKRAFTLTYIPDFFVRLGFKEIEKSSLPHKIWAECLKCPKFPDCDETALIIDL